MHPLKDKKWYREKKATMEDWQAAQELDRSYERSKKGKVYKKFDSSMHMSPEVVHYNENFTQFVTWDFGFAGAMALVFIQIEQSIIFTFFGSFIETMPFLP